jgi:putative transposase
MNREGQPLIQTWRRKGNRLARDAYQGPRQFAVTVVIWQRQQAFTEPAAVERCLALLEATAEECGFTVLVYCFMPDHLHLIVDGSDGSDLTAFMKRFKQGSSYRHKQLTGRPLWQRSYHDRVIRDDAELAAQCDYIGGNPIRAGLADHPSDYAFLGGAVWREEAGGDLKVAATDRRAGIAYSEGNTR